MKLVYVEHTALTTQRFALVVKDDADLKEQLAERERILKEQLRFKSKVPRDPQGKAITYDLNGNWDEFKAVPWDPN